MFGVNGSVWHCFNAAVTVCSAVNTTADNALTALRHRLPNTSKRFAYQSDVNRVIVSTVRSPTRRFHDLVSKFLKMCRKVAVIAI